MAIFMITEAANSNFKGILKGHVHADINHLIISFELQLHCLSICSSLYMAICGGPRGVSRSLNSFLEAALIGLLPLPKKSARTLLRPILSKVSDDGAKKVDLNYFFTITSLNVIMKMNAGKKRVEEEKAACIDSEKQCIEDVQKIFRSNPGTSLLDFFPFLKWIGYNGDIEESTVIKRGMNSCRA
ncbi:hypothetical protein H0E87_028670 [Populus deltoides]|uniref:Uncharacterized protein n=1 Tax=Populus deltoides TaxID=3696 RepID=A0A8T2WU64_POPDE|nr:hypothetical protein H0E87_028670 [Populus deltoides]